MQWFPPTKFVGYCSWLLFLASFMLLGSTTHAALNADYQFQNTFVSSVGNVPVLTVLGTGINEFAVETVDGNSHTVFTFQENNGLSFASTTNVYTYTIVLLVRLATVSGYRRYIDFNNTLSDNGLYNYNGKLKFYPIVDSESTTPIIENSYHQIVITHDDNTGEVVGYVDGVQQFSFIDTNDIAIVSMDNILRFFIDDDQVSGEASAGAVARIRIFSNVLTPIEVATLDRVANPITSPPNVVTNAPSLITATNAILKGTVNPNGADTTVTFDFGLNTDYGQSIAAIPATIAGTAAATAVSANKTGLTCVTTYHYRVTAVNSADTTNGADKAFTTSACPRDLIVTNITLNPAKPVAGTAFSAIVTVKNQGATATPASKLKLWPNLATVPVCTTAASKIADIPALAAGASVNVNVTGLISNLVGGNTFRSFADGTCIIGETNEANNHRTLNYRIGVRVPDLIITNITLTPASPAGNAVFNAAITLKNQGSNVAGSSFLDVWANQATTQTCGAIGNAWAEVGTLTAGASKIINVTGLNAGATAGAKTLRAFVDSWCEETESNEANNQLIKSYTVQ